MKDQQEDIKRIKCVVAGANANGSPDVHTVIVKCTNADYDVGDHYEYAYSDAEENGFEPCICFDEEDPGFKAFNIDWTVVKEIEHY